MPVSSKKKKKSLDLRFHKIKVISGFFLTYVLFKIILKNTKIYLGRNISCTRHFNENQMKTIFL